MTEIVVAKDPGPGVRATAQGWDGVRRRYLPRELRIRLFEEVKRLRKKRLSYRQIVDELYRRHRVKLCIANVSFWSRGLHSPYNGRYIPSIELLKPSKELAYVIGVKLGDGYVIKSGRIKRYNRVCDDVRIGLDVKDREFAEEFSRCLAKVLGSTPKRPRYRKSTKRYIVEFGSETLYQLLKKPVNLDRLKKYIEHCGNCMAAFLRGFFDSEGCIDKRGYMFLSNTDLRLLEYVKHLLQHLGIETTGPRLKTRRGTVIHDPMSGRKYMANKDVYVIGIRANNNLSFYEKVGFTIRRKQKRLEKYLRRRHAKPLPLFSPLHAYSCF